MDTDGCCCCCCEGDCFWLVSASADCRLVLAGDCLDVVLFESFCADWVFKNSIGIGTLIEGDVDDDDDDDEEAEDDVGDEFEDVIDMFESLDNSLDACCLYHEFSVSI